MGFSKRFLKKIADHSGIFGEKMPAILLNNGTLDNAIDNLGEKTIQSLALVIGTELGSETRVSTLKDYNGNALEKLKTEFKNHMNAYGINVLYETKKR